MSKTFTVEEFFHRHNGYVTLHLTLQFQHREEMTALELQAGGGERLAQCRRVALREMEEYTGLSLALPTNTDFTELINGHEKR